MIAYLATLAATIACLLFIVSIPIARTEFGQTLRKGAVGLMLGAVFASFIVDFLRSAVRGAWQAFLASPIEGILTMAVISVIAYVVLRLRRGPAAKPPSRIAMKQPYVHRRRNDDVISILREELGHDDE